MILPLVLILLLVMLTSHLLTSYYASLSVNDLKKRARTGDKNAALLFQVVRHRVLSLGYLRALTLLLFVWVVAYISQHKSLINSIIWILIILFSLKILKSGSHFGRFPARLISGPYARFIVITKPYLQPFRGIFNMISGRVTESMYYDRQDIIEFIRKAASSSSFSSVDKSEAELACNALLLRGKMVVDVMTPRKVVRFVEVDQQISTVLMNELHESGFSRFPVISGNVDTVVGTLYLRDLVERRPSGKIATVMSSEVYEINHDKNMQEALAMFLKTKHHLFVVRNEFAEVVGVLSIEDVLEELIGKQIVDESDVHEDMRELARKPKRQK